jgi:hypothetical protein
MESSDSFPRLARAGFELLGLEPDEAELAVIEAVDALYRPLMQALIEVDLAGVEPEPEIDLSRPPRDA